MKNQQLHAFIEQVIDVMPADWLNLTTHRLDIYNEKLAKTDFLNKLEQLFEAGECTADQLKELPTAYDYIRLGHPLSSILEWLLAMENSLQADQLIAFSSRVTPILAILRYNLFAGKATLICHSDELPACFDVEAVKQVYGYTFETQHVECSDQLPAFDGTIVFIENVPRLGAVKLNDNVDVLIQLLGDLGSVVFVNKDINRAYIGEIQHVRRRETIAMTPINCLNALLQRVGQSPIATSSMQEFIENKSLVKATIQSVTGSSVVPVVGSSGLSIQYAIMMGLIEDALLRHPGKSIQFMVPPNCYGGTNDQARRVAACLKQVEIMDLPVDGDNNMVQSIDRVLERVAELDAVPFIIAEIPTNPRVEVPDLAALKDVLSKRRLTPAGTLAIDPVFILDQTFCPNVQFLGDDKLLAMVRTISYVSGSKFPSGGKCTAGYCVSNQRAAALMPMIEKHLVLCDNEATAQQMAFLAEQLPSMNERIHAAYLNTRDFVRFIQLHLPTANINFVSDELAEQGFTPSVFSLDLPTKGETHEEREAYKRELNLRLIQMMIDRIPHESKYCVSYGQLKGCYWTIPATSTQGTTREGDKDYIVRVAVSHDINLELHKTVFLDFVQSMD
jgi:cystathionine beta-lyase/cystathionine gamma-synthase